MNDEHRDTYNQNTKTNSGAVGAHQPYPLGISDLSPTHKDMYRGYFPLWRKITDWGWYKDSNTMRVFLHLLLHTNFKESYYLGHKIYPGQAVFGRKTLASVLGLGERQIRTALNHLKATSELTIKNCNKFSIITLINFDKYTITTSEKSNRSPKEVRQPTTSKNDKNVKNDNKRDITSLQSVILFYFIIKDYIKDGESIEDKTWVKQNFPRPAKAAKRLLALGTADEIKAMITKGKVYFEEKKLSWTLETIEKCWNEIRAYTGKKKYS